VSVLGLAAISADTGHTCARGFDFLLALGIKMYMIYIFRRVTHHQPRWMRSVLIEGSME
jgi:hypothetical protein